MGPFFLQVLHFHKCYPKILKEPLQRFQLVGLHLRTTAGGEFYTGDAGDANAAAYWPVIGGTTFAMANDDVCNCDMTNAILTTPSMDLSGVSGAVLIYDFVDDLS